MGDRSLLAAIKETDEWTDRLTLLQCCKLNAIYEYRVNTCKICTFFFLSKRTEAVANAEKEKTKRRREEEEEGEKKIITLAEVN